MKKEIEVLEQYGLVRDEDSLKIENLPARKLQKLYLTLYAAVLKQQEQGMQDQNPAPIDPFTFMASASLRADSTCGEYLCRLSKLDFLARYTALYANKVMVPLSLPRPEMAMPNPWLTKYELSKSVLTLLRLRQLVEAGLVVPVLMRSFHCEHTIEWVNKMMEAVHNVAQGISRHSGSDFDESSGWRQKNWHFNRAGKVELRGRKKAWVLYQGIFESIANDTTFYLAFARMHSTRYLSDRTGETLFLEGMTEDAATSANSKIFHDALAHQLPLGDLPIATLLRIRREERDSFIRYRAALQQLLAETLATKKKIQKAHVVEIYKERIEPALLRMRSELKEERRRQSRRVAGGVATLAASVALGAFGVFLPVAAKVAASAAGAMVGGRLLSKAAEAQCEHGSNLREKNDFYFLLRVAQEAGLE